MGKVTNNIKPVGENVYGKYSYAKETHQKCGVKKQDWEKVDKATLPLVKKAIKELQGQNGDRPHKVNVFAVSKKLGLSDKRLYLLPKCMKEVLKHQESQEQYWAKEVIWAINKIQNDGIAFNWKQIRVLTNMRKDNLIASLPQLEVMDSDIAEMVRAIV